jgi:hypothetical protein
MLAIIRLSLCNMSFYLVVERGFKDVIYLYSVSKGHFLIYIDSLNSKENSGFNRCSRHCIIIVCSCN